MSVRVRCQCGAALKARDELAGRRIRCPKCRQVVSVPALDRPPQQVLPGLAADRDHERRTTSIEPHGIDAARSADSKNSIALLENRPTRRLGDAVLKLKQFWAFLLAALAFYWSHRHAFRAFVARRIPWLADDQFARRVHWYAASHGGDAERTIQIDGCLVCGSASEEPFTADSRTICDLERPLWFAFAAASAAVVLMLAFGPQWWQPMPVLALLLIGFRSRSSSDASIRFRCCLRCAAPQSELIVYAFSDSVMIVTPSAARASANAPGDEQATVDKPTPAADALAYAARIAAVSLALGIALLPLASANFAHYLVAVIYQGKVALGWAPFLALSGFSVACAFAVAVAYETVPANGCGRTREAGVRAILIGALVPPAMCLVGSGSKSWVFNTRSFEQSVFAESSPHPRVTFCLCLAPVLVGAVYLVGRLVSRAPAVNVARLRIVIAASLFVAGAVSTEISWMVGAHHAPDFGIPRSEEIQIATLPFIGSQSLSRFLMISLLLAVPVYCIGVVALYLYRTLRGREVVPDANGVEAPRIGGWLWLPLVGLIYGLISEATALPLLHSWYYGRASSHNAEMFVSALVMWSTSIVIGAAVFVVFSFIERRRFVPKFMIALYGVNVALAILALLGANAFIRTVGGQGLGVEGIIMREQLKAAMLIEVGRSIVVAMIWIPYFLYSKRVESTFIR